LLLIESSKPNSLASLPPKTVFFVRPFLLPLLSAEPCSSVPFTEFDEKLGDYRKKYAIKRWRKMGSNHLQA
jgi:hypothetical protein